jgi:hypothetical protein
LVLTRPMQRNLEQIIYMAYRKSYLQKNLVSSPASVQIGDDICTLFAMSHAEREELKSFASRGECLKAMLTAIVHWMRQTPYVSFSDYVSNWAEANRNQPFDVEALRKQWPHSGPRFIATGFSDWNPKGIQPITGNHQQF